MSAKKRGLGRGLDALIPQPEQPSPEPGTEAAVTALPIARLRPNRMQPRTRFDEAQLEELAESIRAQGIVQPLVVTPAADGLFDIIAGERRWRAARRAGLESVPVVVRTVADDRELLELALVENLQRSDLDPMEEAEAYQALQETFGLTQEEVAVRVGKSRTAVTNALRLLKLPEEVQSLLRDGRLTAGPGAPAAGAREPRGAGRARRARRAEGLSARELERLAAVPREKQAEEGSETGRGQHRRRRGEAHPAPPDAGRDPPSRQGGRPPHPLPFRGGADEALRAPHGPGGTRMIFKSDGKQNDLNGFLDQGSHAQGDLRFETSFRVDGKLTGTIESEGRPDRGRGGRDRR